MTRILPVFVGLAAYAVFLLAFLYAVGFVEGAVVPKSINSGEVVPTIDALVLDVLLLSLFALQHSLMARQTFKRWWTRFVPGVIERSIYVLLASLALLFLFWQWRPIPSVIWSVSDPTVANALLGLSLLGWFSCLACTRCLQASGHAPKRSLASGHHFCTRSCVIRSILASSSHFGRLP